MCLARPSSTQKSNAANMSVKSNPGKSVCGRRELKYVKKLSQNTKGYNEDKEEIILALMQQKFVRKTYLHMLYKKPGDLAKRSPKNTATI